MRMPSSPEIIILLAILGLWVAIFKKNSIFVLIGAIVGLFLMKSIAFNMEETLGWMFFWDAIQNKHLNENDIGEIVKSTTFIKSMIGLILGALLGFLLGKRINEIRGKKDDKF